MKTSRVASMATPSFSIALRSSPRACSEIEQRTRDLATDGITHAIHSAFFRFSARHWRFIIPLRDFFLIKMSVQMKFLFSQPP